MKAEIVFIIFQELDNEQKERFKSMLDKEKPPTSKNKKKSKIWNEMELTEKLIIRFKEKVNRVLYFIKIFLKYV
jgi:hypothetical protein